MMDNPADYYNYVLNPPEESSLDFSQPFQLFSGAIRIGLSERINVLERETVRILQERLRNKTIEVVEEKTPSILESSSSEEEKVPSESSISEKVEVYKGPDEEEW